MPRIDQLVDATVGHPRMSFLDAFQGYHQIPLAVEDQEKTAFVTPVRNYHYKVMPFGLKNAGSTYQRMMTKMFESRLGKTIEVYIDDMAKKSFEGQVHTWVIKKGKRAIVYKTMEKKEEKIMRACLKKLMAKKLCL